MALEVEVKLNSLEISREEKELELLKIDSYSEVLKYMEGLISWLDPNENLSKNYELWKAGNSRGNEKVRVSNYRFNNMMRNRIGNKTINGIFYSNSVKELEGVIESFRTSIHLEYLSDLLKFCSKPVRGVKPEFRFAEFQIEKDPESPYFREEAHTKRLALQRILTSEEDVYKNTKAAFVNYFQKLLDFAEVLIAINMDLVSYKESLKGR